ncbi:MAG: recO [Rhodospirillales bacterium]|nr:recO [Rhodospirillales bacterium]
MQWDDEAVVLAARPHGETSLIVTLLTRSLGRRAGLIRGGRRARGRGVYEIGTRVEAHWQARLAEHLGLLRLELVRGCAAELMDDPARLSCLAAATAMAEATLPEGEAAPECYAGLLELIAALVAGRDWAARYITWELALLAELGFGLDLASCAVTGATSDLAYVSPKSGQAVSRAAAAPYRDKLLALPRFLLDPGVLPTIAEVADGLRLTGFFLERHVFAPFGRPLPASRSRFVDRMEQIATISGTESGPPID